MNIPRSIIVGGAGIWTPGATVIGGNTSTFNQQIQKLFANNEQGFFYDPNDLSTMFRDAAGTVPVTDVGQPVGLMLDKSKGLALSAEKLTNGDFSNGSTGWNYTARVWDFTNGFARKNPNIAGETDLTQGSAIVGKWYKVTYTISRHVSGIHYARCGSAVGVAKDGIGTFTSYVLATSTAGIGFGASVVADLDLVNISVKEIEGNHAFQTNSASRPILRKNAVTGFNYLEFDGSDDFLQTNSIDFTAANKMSLFAGLECTGNATIGAVLETGSNYTNPTGGFGVMCPYSIGTNSVAILASSGGAAVHSVGASAPSVLTYTGFIDLNKTTAKDQVKMRVNGAYDTASRMGLAGNGNLANVPMYIGRRGGTSIPFNGHIYSLISVGRLTTDEDTLELEKELAKRTGATLSV